MDRGSFVNAGTDTFDVLPWERLKMKGLPDLSWVNFVLYLHQHSLILPSNADPAYSSSWPPLLFMMSLYTHSLLTIGDDEFFSLSSSSATAPRNALTIDDLIAFSRQLLHIAFPLYWFEDQAKVKGSGPAGVKFTWEKVRELVSGCLKGIHARE